jgi:hypothetical protein
MIFTKAGNRSPRKQRIHTSSHKFTVISPTSFAAELGGLFLSSVGITALARSLHAPQNTLANLELIWDREMRALGSISVCREWHSLAAMAKSVHSSVCDSHPRRLC